MPEHPIKGFEYLSLPTPVTTDYNTAASRWGIKGFMQLRDVDFLLRSPTASQGQGGALGEAEARKRGNTVGIRDQAMDLAKLQGHKVSREAHNLIGTPRSTAANSSQKQVKAGAPKGRIEDQVLMTDWGKFEPAIRRWEAILGRQAPEPTKPDGKDGNHRLSSKFTEWMMGLPDGWITGHDLKRNDELKLAGNGVVPQQAELALRLLLELPEIREN